MPLVPVPGAAAYEAAEVVFAMMDPADPAEGRQTVTVTVGALDGLTSSDLSGPEMAAWVDRYRTEFETIASAKYDAGLSLRITVADWMLRFPIPA